MNSTKITLDSSTISGRIRVNKGFAEQRYAKQRPHPLLKPGSSGEKTGLLYTPRPKPKPARLSSPVSNQYCTSQNYNSETDRAAQPSKPEAYTNPYILQQFRGTDMSQQKASSRLANFFTRMLYSFSTVAIVFAAVMGVRAYAALQQQEPAVLASEITDSIPAENAHSVTEVAVSEEALIAYQVEPDMPRYLRVPSVGVFARVAGSGVEPTDLSIDDVMWDADSALPGEIGTSIFTGQVSGDTKPGVFQYVQDISKGDPIIIEKGSGDTIRYEVVDVTAQTSMRLNQTQAHNHDVEIRATMPSQTIVVYANKL